VSSHIDVIGLNAMMRVVVSLATKSVGNGVSRSTRTLSRTNRLEGVLSSHTNIAAVHVRLLATSSSGGEGGQGEGQVLPVPESSGLGCATERSGLVSSFLISCCM
jgi:hypothetical protein